MADRLCAIYFVSRHFIVKITTTENNTIQLKEVFNSIVLKTKDGEEMAICMRDSGFEFKYQGEWYFAKEGYVEPFHKSVRGNYLVEQKHNVSGQSEQCNHKFERVEKGGEFQGNQCDCGEWEDLT